MSNVAANYYTLTVLTPILAGREGHLRDHLRALPRGAGSPLAKLPTLHFGRWVIIPELRYQGPPQKPDNPLKLQYLLFSAHFDGTELDPYLDELHARLGAGADTIWGNCVGYPGRDDPAKFKAYFRHNQIDATLFYPGYAASVAEIKAKLTLRERLVDFVLAHQGCDAETLLKEWRGAFGRVSRVLR